MLNWRKPKKLFGDRVGIVTMCNEYSIIRAVESDVYELCAKRGVIWYTLEFSEDKDFLKAQAEKHNNSR